MSATRKQTGNEYGRLIVDRRGGTLFYYPRRGVARRVDLAQVRLLAERGEISPDNLAELERQLSENTH